jgi:hypothetical protein
VTIGIVPYSAVTTGAVEPMRDDDDDKNRLCPVVVFTGLASDLLRIASQGMTGLAARRRIRSRRVGRSVPLEPRLR